MRRSFKTETEGLLMRFRTGFLVTAVALVIALIPAVAFARSDNTTTDPFGTTAGTTARTAWGNTCAANITDYTGSPMYWQSESHWPTDTWQTDPSGTMIDNLQTGGSGDDTGGFGRGCHDEVDWVLNNGVTISIQDTDPYTGGNDFPCVTSNPSEYQCTLDSSSVIHGPILLTNWTINKIS
jgi:hypothetical protein